MARKPATPEPAELQMIPSLPQAGGAYVIDPAGNLIPDPDEARESPVEAPIEAKVEEAN